MRASSSSLVLLLVLGCVEPIDRTSERVRGRLHPPLPPTPTTTSTPIDAIVTDLGVSSGFQGGTQFGHFTRGRSCSVADFDNDGLQDIALGNPGDISYVLRNTSPAPGEVTFELMLVLMQPVKFGTNTDVAWALQPADYDNDGDIDLFAAMGGIESEEFNHLYRNELVPSGVVSFTDVADEAGVLGPRDLFRHPHPAGNAGAQWGDVDRDGWVDLYVGENAPPGEELSPLDWQGYDVLYINQRDGTFRDVSKVVGFLSQGPTRHPQLFDLDNDGDLDVYENNYNDEQVIWRNQLTETGALDFLDATDELSLDGSDLRALWNTFASSTMDLNNDGWEDVIAWVRGYPVEPFPLGHTVLLNVEGRGFVDATAVTELNSPFDPGIRSHETNGVMGCSPTDVTADGLPDIYIANGGPEMGWTDGFYVARELVDHEFPGVGTLKVPVYDNWSALVDFPAEQDPLALELGAEYPTYPYRGHATCVADFDRDGVPEIAVQNGGTLLWGGDIGSREPNRLFQVHLPEPGHWLAVQPYGDGLTVSRDAIGTRLKVTAATPDGGTRVVHLTLKGGNSFSAMNGFELFFGLGDATAVTELELRWPDGEVDVITEGLVLDQRIEVYR